MEKLFNVICPSCGQVKEVKNLELLHWCSHCDKRFMVKADVVEPDENVIYTTETCK